MAAIVDGGVRVGYQSPIVAPDGSPDLLTNIYTKIDRAVGSLLETHRGPETTVIAIFSLGISEVNPISRLLLPLLQEINQSMGAPSPGRKLRAFIERVPNRVHRLALRLLGRDFEDLDHWVDSYQRFFPVALFPIFGGIRLNLEGREPSGIVAVAVADKEAVLVELENEFRALRDLDTGVPLVTGVQRAAHYYPTDPR